jgi:hypothetical protein
MYIRRIILRRRGARCSGGYISTKNRKDSSKTNEISIRDRTSGWIVALVFLAAVFPSRTLILRNVAAVLANPVVACYPYYLLVGIIAIVVHWPELYVAIP